MTELSAVQKAIAEECDSLKRLLLEKNQSYGNSVFEPIRLFAKNVPALSQILVRIDDKLNRIQHGSGYKDEDTILDLAGYLVLYRVAVRLTRGEEPGALPRHGIINFVSRVAARLTRREEGTP